jgi:hypothetical protein
MFELDNETSWTDEFHFDVDTKNSSENITDFYMAGRNRTYLNVPYVVMEIIVAIFAVIGNATVIVVFFRERRLRKRTNYYIISLAFADFLGEKIIFRGKAAYAVNNFFISISWLCRDSNRYFGENEFSENSVNRQFIVSDLHRRT